MTRFHRVIENIRAYPHDTHGMPIANNNNVTMDKKRHHYIAKAYLRAFCNDGQKVCVYSKDKHGEYWFASPDSIGFENYYYSQPTPNGGRDNNRLEDCFSKFETKWTPLVEKLEKREPTDDNLKTLLEFVLMHRVRVPTARNGIEKMLAEAVKMTARHMYEGGMLPPVPLKLTYDEIERHTEIAIDPHRSIHAMSDLAKGVCRVIDAIGFEVLENKTDVEFVTSDNPVAYFDPTVSESSVEPYNISPNRMDIELLFPITPKFILWGHTVLKDHFDRRGVPYRSLSERAFVTRANRFVMRFADRYIFSRTASHQSFVKRYASKSPVMKVAHIKTATGRGIVAQSVFGKRETKPKWRSCSDDSAE